MKNVLIEVTWLEVCEYLHWEEPNKLACIFFTTNAILSHANHLYHVTWQGHSQQSAAGTDEPMRLSTPVTPLSPLRISYSHM